MTADTEKLKALALAATPGPWSAIEWTCAAPTTVRAGAVGITVADTTGHGRNSEVCAIDAAFIAAANPATVLELCNENAELRAEVERLRAAANVRETPWYRAACKMGNALYNLGQRDDLPAGWKENAHDLAEEWDEARKGIGSAPAAGTEKDAERYRHIRDTANNGYALSGPAGIGKWQVSRKMRGGEGEFFFGLRLDAMIDSDIAAIGHTKAGKEPTC